MANTSSFARAKGGKGKRPYNRKLENGPKRPLSAYNFFFRAERLKLCEGITINTQTTKKGKRAHRKSHGAVNFSDMGKRIAAAWKALDEAGRAPFVAEAAEDLKRYQQAKEEALEQAAAAVAKSPRRNNIVNDDGAPKRKKTHRESALVLTNVAQKTTKMSHQETKASPPIYPESNDGSLPPSTTTAATTFTQDYAYQCEVCLTAIFPSYHDCLQHEQECAKNKERERQNETEELVQKETVRKRH
mmetsp:Transcript_11288/g.18664  ORF Transcript_11288/g.18664 Transcript_11288/m.18664 type:complete len:245 (+) Transcript_11288:128-862(+)